MERIKRFTNNWLKHLIKGFHSEEWEGKLKEPLFYVSGVKYFKSKINFMIIYSLRTFWVQQINISRHYKDLKGTDLKGILKLK